MSNSVKKSIRDKYNRREKWLYYSIKDYLAYAEDRLNEEVAGQARNRTEIEEIVKRSKELLNILPVPKDEFNEIDCNVDFISLLENSRSVEEILKEAEEWRKNLSEEQWQDILNYAASKKAP